MEQKELKYIKGKLEYGKPATICFFDEVDHWSVNDFVWELNYIKDNYAPSRITILINSCGGSCVDGISAFSAIINCDVPTTCVIEGIAASMGSVIWAAGDECKMRDYGLLMIHNPWTETKDANEETKRTIEVFTSQLKTIYMKRFNMDEEKVTAIMNGEANLDGTFFTAQQAVEAGFISQENVIETPGVDKIAAHLSKMQKPKAMVSYVQKIINKNQEISIVDTINKKDETATQSNKTEKEMNQEFTVVAALLGLTGEKANEAEVSAKIQDLAKAESELTSLRAQFESANTKITELTTELEGSKASVENLTKNLEDAQNALNEYKKAEEEARTASINALLDDCIKAGKITKESRETWAELANNNLELAKQTLASIPARADIAEQIANDPENKEEAEENLNAEAEVEAKVKAVVGENFKFHALSK